MRFLLFFVHFDVVKLRTIELAYLPEAKEKNVSEVPTPTLHNDWSKLNSPDDLLEKLDDYDTLRSTFRSKQPRKEWHYDKQNSFKDDPAVTTTEKKKAVRSYT
ncbi:hypothetical protein AVEN_123587-1 [Araneus ventricosus]|uniref:Uncharacterized protein n=1 Tax=Araneus ventricosus TaxID=182803 RepID=A0A4Y2MQ71_ARAVE|nr:hypothetical protein AVEN_123587-1 [Araneus ventricosus]